MYVVKRDGERQRFDRTKLRAALLRAAHKRPVSAEDVEALVDRIELAAADGAAELSSERIGELCLEGLRELDWGAYLQFAGTLPTIGAERAPLPTGSVRAAREDPESTPKAASRRELDE
jgi:transcriptional regulator NrdR family protein